MPGRELTPRARSWMLGAALIAVATGAGQVHAEEGLRVVAGDGTAGFSDAEPVRFRKPIRLAPFGEHGVLVADIFNHAIRAVSREGRVTTLVGGPDKQGHRDGPATEAQLNSPHGVAVSASGVIAVAEAGNHTIRLLTPEGETAGERRYVVSTLAGVPGQSGMQDGPANQALFSSPHAVVWTEDGGLLVADIGNARIRRIHDGSVSTVAGSGEAGRRDGAALEASFQYPMDIALRPGGTLAIADAGTHLVRLLSPHGQVSTLSVAGELHTPHGISAGPEGTLYIADMKAHQVVAIDSEGRISRICGTGQAGATPHQLNRPAAVLYHDGLVWVADLDNHRISAIPAP